LPQTDDAETQHEWISSRIHFEKEKRERYKVPESSFPCSPRSTLVGSPTPYLCHEFRRKRTRGASTISSR
jgi:hypothetical protein